MAELIPKSLPGGEPQGLREFWRTLRKLSDIRAWCSMNHRTDSGKPRILLLWRQRYAFLIQVAETTQQLAERALHGDLFDPDSCNPDSLARAEEEILSGFARIAGRDFGELPVRKLVVFPNVAARTIDEIVLRKSEDTDILYLGMHQEPVERFGMRLEALAVSAVSPPGLIHLRGLLTPESAVPPTFNARAIPERNTAAGLLPSFLDIDQEWCVKNDLELPPEQQRAAAAADTRLVTGVAGSGKSLVLLYRSILFARTNPGARILVITHNKPLRFELERRAEALEGGGTRFECHTFFQWAHSVVGTFPGKVLRNDQIRETLHQLREGHANLAGVSTDYLVDEIGWIKDHGFLRREQYLAAERKGRGLALKPEQKSNLWNILQTYQHHLDHTGSCDWHNIALRFHRAAYHGQIGFPRYDAIFVDEAQFFARIWFETVRAALKPGGHLFLSADPTQGFLRRSQSWLSAGIEVRGKTTRLSTAYRNTRAILRFARDFYRSRHTADDELELNVPDDDMLAAMTETGEAPEIVHLSSSQDEIARAVNEIAAMRESGFPPGLLLVLHTSTSMAANLARQLGQKIGEDQVHPADQGKRPEGAFCSVSGLNAATGLEAPVVFLLGMDRLLEEEADPRLSPEERAERIRDNTRKLYMGFTRAGQRLVVFRTRTLEPSRGTAGH